MLIIDILSFSCPLLLCAMGALYSDYAGILAIFLEGLVSFSAFLMFYFTVTTGSALLGCLLTAFSALFCVLIFAIIIEKLRANPFIGATAINLLFASLPSLFSVLAFNNRGVLTSQNFIFPVFQTKVLTIVITLIVLSLAFLFLSKTKAGLYIRITGTDSDVLTAKGVNYVLCRISSWAAAAFFAGLSGALLAMRVSSFVPGISSGRGWMALAAVYLGKKNPLRISLSVLIFCAADFFATQIQNYLPALPTSVVLALPYLVILLVVGLGKK
ncbi:putative ABC-type transport system, permease component [Treponema sp. JC4]|uniref:ABC transporter permease subunit n=1 Tax=Treponema sp. JC4 TaxID=1124982 RepID=UPI00025B045D|nr:ABC transporter permease [Treponema sp. JC4]EID86144.1 putative ABC-type transport system, permease component [Treponema sp. JC4]